MNDNDIGLKRSLRYRIFRYDMHTADTWPYRPCMPIDAWFEQFAYKIVAKFRAFINWPVWGKPIEFLKQLTILIETLFNRIIKSAREWNLYRSIYIGLRHASVKELCFSLYNTPVWMKMRSVAWQMKDNGILCVWSVSACICLQASSENGASSKIIGIYRPVYRPI